MGKGSEDKAVLGLDVREEIVATVIANFCLGT